MMEKFIYVFSKKDADDLAALGYKLLHCDNDNKKYILSNDVANPITHMTFSENNICYVLSNTLTF